MSISQANKFKSASKSKSIISDAWLAENMSLNQSNYN